MHGVVGVRAGHACSWRSARTIALTLTVPERAPSRFARRARRLKMLRGMRKPRWIIGSFFFGVVIVEQCYTILLTRSILERTVADVGLGLKL